MAFMDWIGKNIKFITEKELANMPKKRFNIDEYPGKYVMYCENQEELFKFYDYLHKVSRKWCTGYSYNEQRPTTDFGDRRIRYIYFNDGTYGSYHNIAAKPDWIILNFKDFDWSDSTMKFKVGDKVRVKNDLKTWRKYGGYTYTEGMRETFGDKVVTISCVEHECGYEHYHLTEDIMWYCWTDEMLELAEEKQFTKADLKTGMVVMNAEGTYYMVFGQRLLGKDDATWLEEFTDDLKDVDDLSELDIMAVYKVNFEDGCFFDIKDVFDRSNLELVWERKEEEVVKEMSVEEIEKELGYKVKVVNKED